MQVLDFVTRKSRMGRRFKFISLTLFISVVTFYLFGQYIFNQETFKMKNLLSSSSYEEDTGQYLTSTITTKIRVVDQRNNLNNDHEALASYFQSSNSKSTPVNARAVKHVMNYPQTTDTTTTTTKSASVAKNTPVLLVTYLRSGSTLTADIIAQSDDVFYIYEPLHSFAQQVYYTETQMCDISTGDCRYPITELEDPEVIKVTLLNILTCQLSNLTHRIYYDMRFHAKRSKVLYQYNECRKTQPQQICIDQLEKVCHQKPIKSVKEIKITMDIANWLMGVIPNLKVIHLLRDPRGMLASQKSGHFILNNASMVARSACNRLKHDVMATHKMSNIYPGRIKQIIYEDIAESPVSSTHQIYNFLGLTVSQNITNYVLNITKSGKENNGYYNVVRGDSVKTAYKWRGSLSWRTVHQIDTECQEFFELTGFKRFENELNYQDKSFKSRVTSDILKN